MFQPFPSETSWRRIAYRFVISACAALSTGCVDLRPPVPETAYRATVLVGPDPASAQSSALPLEFLEFYQAGKWRRESDADGQTGVRIDRSDLRVTWALDTHKKSFGERHISEMDERIPWLLNPFGPRAKADFELIGTEDIAGIDARKYEVSGQRVEGLAWFTHDGVPLRFRGTIRTVDAHTRARAKVEIDYKQIERGQQPAWLFAIPPNFVGYEDRKKPEAPSASTDSESVRRARESLERGQMQGSGPSY